MRAADHLEHGLHPGDRPAQPATVPPWGLRLEEYGRESRSKRRGRLSRAPDRRPARGVSGVRRCGCRRFQCASTSMMSSRRSGMTTGGAARRRVVLGNVSWRIPARCRPRPSGSSSSAKRMLRITLS
jgi:hypothetical protein